MNRRILAWVGLFALGVLLSWGRVPGGFTAEEAIERDNLDVQLAGARLRMAEANLKRVERTNQRVAKSVPADIVKLYAQDVELAQHQVALAKAGEAGETFEMWLERAASSAKLAEDQWRRAVAANRRTAGTVDELDVERLRLRTEVARLQWAKGKTLVDRSAEEKLAWQAELLYDEMHRLKLQIVQTAPSGRVYLRWWY